MRNPPMHPGRLSPKLLNAIFWGAFAAIAIGAFVMAPSLGYTYSSEISIATYAAVVQGAGALLALTATGLFVLKLKIDSAISSLEERTLGVLNNRLGWSIIRWSEELEARLEEEFLGAAYTEVYQEEGGSEDYLEKELDELLDAILVEEESGGQTQREVAHQEARPTLSTDVKEVLAAMRERRALMARRAGLIRIMGGPLAMLAVLVGSTAWALPASGAFLMSQASLNTALIFTSTYGGVVALLFTAAAALKAAVS